jgi:ABC-type Mn2+/Zn2+ transport system ATPase subunit
VGLAGRERDLVGLLSGGQRARVSLAAALLGAPELLILPGPAPTHDLARPEPATPGARADPHRDPRVTPVPA